MISDSQSASMHKNLASNISQTSTQTRSMDSANRQLMQHRIVLVSQSIHTHPKNNSSLHVQHEVDAHLSRCQAQHSNHFATRQQRGSHHRSSPLLMQRLPVQKVRPMCCIVPCTASKRQTEANSQACSRLKTCRCADNCSCIAIEQSSAKLDACMPGTSRSKETSGAHLLQQVPLPRLPHDSRPCMTAAREGVPAPAAPGP